MGKKRALVYTDRLFSCADGKIAHGLIRHSNRFEILGVIDSTLTPGDAGEILDGISRNIPLFRELDMAYNETNPDTFIIGAVSDGGVLPAGYDQAVIWALTHGLNIVSGLHQFLSEDTRFIRLAREYGCTITDVRKIFRDKKRFYTGEIKEVQAKRIAILGTDSAVGKRTIAVILNEALRKQGYTSDMIYTGQTGWMQGWPHGIVLDAIINDFVAGGIEGAILDSWRDDHPDYMLIEGQGSLVHPFFPGGFEILAAGRIDGFILVDAPKRKHLDGFPGYAMPDQKRVIQIATLLTEKPMLGIGINKENMTPEDIIKTSDEMHRRFQVPVVEPLTQDVTPLIKVLVDLNDK